jgi:NAD(P) transhydrogenase subunit beta
VANLPLIAYLLAAILFILSLGGLASQATARRGNLFGIVGMALAVGATLADPTVIGGEAPVLGVGIVLAAVGLGGVVGAVLAVRVKMTGMPQLVAALHSFVGLAAVLVAWSTHVSPTTHHLGVERVIHDVEIGIAVAAGALTFTGSLVAWLKLDGRLSGAPLLLPGRHVLHAALVAACVALVAGFAAGGFGVVQAPWILGVITVLAGILGAHLVLAIGGADMPVVVSLLNSYSGWTAAAAGFMLENDLLIITGALVGSSGAILSAIMCRGMNRSIWSVVFGGFGTAGGGAPAATVEGEMLEIDVEGLADALWSARSVIVVPGYGMAVAQAQRTLQQVTRTLLDRGADVRFAIHPVAGRLPGHMNVLLAEAGVPHRLVLELDEINDDFPSCDVVLVVGANDIVNPSAIDDPNSPIAGMPVLHAWEAKLCVVFKRGRGAGYAGIDNPLFVHPHTRMCFGDAGRTLDALLGALRERASRAA